ncbi:efflux RND transporter permease subunit, partial [Shewanella sp. TC10]|uniref:efflux RND transporter permease subunit n=1 Tax=Shewanella sp. TC10 TaxID=1419739 RepID=UPI001892AE74
MIAWFTKNHVAANLLMLFLLVIGLGSLSTRIPLEVFPSVDSEVVSVNISLRGATPEDVEQGVTIRVEEAVQDLEGIKKITSTSSEASSSVRIEVESNYDPRELLADIKSRVDSINTFPVDAEKPVIALAQRKREVIAVTVTGKYSEKETLEFAEVVRDELLRLDGVTQLDLSGVRNYEVTLEVSQDKLQQYQLTLSEIARAINASSTDISAGNLKTQGGDILLRSKGQAYYKDEFANIA